MKNNIEMPHTHRVHQNSLSWSAIICGALIALGLGFILQLFSLAIGLSAYHSSASGETLAIGGVLGLIIGVIVSMGIAGLVSGCLGRFCRFHPSEAFIYGFSTWSMALLLNALLILPLTHYASNSQEMVAKGTSGLHHKVMMTQKDSSVTQSQVTGNVPSEEVKAAQTTIERGSWVLFILFFLGAIASCIGAYCGMMCKKNHEHSEMDPYLK